MQTTRATYGQLMDWANEKNDDRAKDFIRKAFQGFCSAKNLPAFDAGTVWAFRNTVIEIGLDEKALEALAPMLGVTSGV